METALIALAGTIFGGGGLKLIEWFLNRGKVKDDIATGIRNEIRADLDRVRDELKHEADAADKYREELYKTKEAYMELKYSVKIANYKGDKVAEVVASEHPASGLKEDLEGLEHPDK